MRISYVHSLAEHGSTETCCRQPHPGVMLTVIWTHECAPLEVSAPHFGRTICGLRVLGAVVTICSRLLGYDIRQVGRDDLTCGGTNTKFGTDPSPPDLVKNYSPLHSSLLLRADKLIPCQGSLSIICPIKQPTMGCSLYPHNAVPFDHVRFTALEEHSLRQDLRQFRASLCRKSAMLRPEHKH